MSSGWFPLDDECEPVQGRFLMALRRHALDWPRGIDPQHSGAFVVDGELTSLRMDYDGSLLSADESVGGLGVAGTPDACAAEGSRWFLARLRAVR